MKNTDEEHSDQIHAALQGARGGHNSTSERSGRSSRKEYNKNRSTLETGRPVWGYCHGLPMEAYERRASPENAMQDVVRDRSASYLEEARRASLAMSHRFSQLSIKVLEAWLSAIRIPLGSFNQTCVREHYWCSIQ